MDSMPSTVIKNIGYDAAKKILSIEYVSGKSYIYKQVPEALYIELRQSKVKGIFFNRNIRGKYQYEKVSD